MRYKTIWVYICICIGHCALYSGTNGMALAHKRFTSITAAVATLIPSLLASCCISLYSSLPFAHAAHRFFFVFCVLITCFQYKNSTIILCWCKWEKNSCEIHNNHIAIISRNSKSRSKAHQHKCKMAKIRSTDQPNIRTVRYTQSEKKKICPKGILWIRITFRWVLNLQYRQIYTVPVPVSVLWLQIKFAELSTV